MSRRLLWWSIACLSIQAPLLEAQPNNDTWLHRPFMQRVNVTDFLLLETNSDLALSPAQQLVVCFTSRGESTVIERAVALRRKSRGVYVLSYLVAQPSDAVNPFHRQELQLDPEIAQNILACFRRLLEYKVIPVRGPLHKASENDDAWIFLRAEDNKTAAGVALNSELHSNAGEESAIYRDLCAGLFGVFVAPDERDTVLKQLDRLTAVYVRTNRLDRR